MNTFLSHSQEVFKTACRQYVAKEIAPFAADFDSGTQPSNTLFRKFGADGYLALTIPQQHGGKDLSFLHAALLCEAIAQYDAGLSVALAAHIAVIELLKAFGTAEQQSQLLTKLASGDMVATLAIHEEQAGTDIEALSTQARVISPTQLKLTGSKASIVNAAFANLVVVAARTTADSQDLSVKAPGPLLYLIGPVEQTYFSPRPARLGLKSVAAADIVFGDMPINTYGVLPGGGNNLEQIMFAFDITKTLAAAAAVGVAEAAFQDSVAHARTRKQFGQNIGTFQAIKWKIADMSVSLDGARLQLYRAAWSKDKSPVEFRKNAAMAKWFACRAAQQSAGEAVQILGLRGLEIGTRVEKLYRDAKALEIAEGTSEFQKMALVRELNI